MEQGYKKTKIATKIKTTISRAPAMGLGVSFNRLNRALTFQARMPIFPRTQLTGLVTVDKREVYNMSRIKIVMAVLAAVAVPLFIIGCAKKDEKASPAAAPTEAAAPAEAPASAE